MKINKKKNLPVGRQGKSGFTLIELLIAMVILAIITVSILGGYFISQKRGRDAKRKRDLKNIEQALEMYYNDYHSYPLSSGGQISVPSVGVLSWSEDEFKDQTGTLYMKKLPGDPRSSNPQYCYESTDGSYFKIYTNLENDTDADLIPGLACDSENYDWGVASSNVDLGSGVSQPTTVPPTLPRATQPPTTAPTSPPLYTCEKNGNECCTLECCLIPEGGGGSCASGTCCQPGYCQEKCDGAPTPTGSFIE